MDRERQAAIDWLSGYKNYLLFIEQISEDIKRTESEIDCIRSSDFTGIKSNNWKKHDIVELNIMEREKSKRERLIEMSNCEQEKQEIIKVIRMVEDQTLQVLLWYRYIDCLKWDDVSEKMVYCWQHIHRLHKKAIDMVVAILKDLDPDKLKG